ncbi:putative nuclear RNA export factor SDE5 isoform X2 [Cornus florida]|uniref:putative nuclear RNA export factor SDE5 isoform X2 n=1 Tax=Cornus florida TaxID=4283 RepID=UPI00289873FA|nr:putative nuclear RNA export factor SDE5 isoform X2 [Cornus florida]
MEASGSSILRNDDEERALECLLDAFGSVFSLEDIASVYCKAGRNANLAGSMLFNLQESNSTSNGEAVSEKSSESFHIRESDVQSERSSESLPIHASNGEIHSERSSKSSCIRESNDEMQSEKSLDLSYNTTFDKFSCVDGNSKESKSKSRPASAGTISCVLDKNYLCSTSLTHGACMTTKPLKVDSKDLLRSELEGEHSSINLGRENLMDNEIEDFLFKMLGDGFQLDRDTMQDIIGSCGYDMKKSTEKLGDLSAATSEKRNIFPDESIEKSLDGGPRELRERHDLQKEILAAFFVASEKHEESPRRTDAFNSVERSRASGRIVVEPLKDNAAEHETGAMNQHQDIKEDDGDDSYLVLRRAVKEYRATMKEYYKAAFEALAEGNNVRAANLLEKGNFFNRRAREADEESSKQIFDTRNGETEDTISLDLHNCGTKEAIRLLKCHLSSVSGIQSIKYLKVIVETNDEDMSKGARKRLIIKLLKKESIKWTEEGSAGTILIRVDEINPKRLSFATKQ